MKPSAPTTVDEKNFLLSIIFPVTSLAGLAQLLRSGKELDKRSVCSAILYSGLTGVGIAAMMIHYFGAENWAMILGVSVLSGLGGTSATDFVVLFLRKGLSQVIKSMEDERKPPE